jgi:hypothetical protein
MKAKITGRLDYGAFSAVERALLWSRAIKRGDADEAARLLRTCPVQTGSVREVAFIAAAVRLHPELAGDILGFNAAAQQQKFDIAIERLPTSIASAREMLADHDARQQKGVA